MQKAVLDDFPNADISVIIVWIDILPGDSLEAARRTAPMLPDSRVRHFHDPRPHLAGSAFRTDLVKRGPAWDIYLFYDKNARWDAGPPPTVDWWHQLSGGDRADPDRYAAGVLQDRLHESMHKVTGATCANHGAPPAHAPK